MSEFSDYLKEYAAKHPFTDIKGEPLYYKLLDNCKPYAIEFEVVVEEDFWDLLDNE